MYRCNVLHIITSMAVGGAEKVLLDLCKNLDKTTNEVHAIGLDHQNYLLDDFKKHSTNALSLGMKRNAKSLVKTMMFLSSYIDKNNINIIHAHMFHPFMIAFFLKIRHPSLKIVFTSHNVNIGEGLREPLTKLLKIFRSADILFSKEMKTDMYIDNFDVIVNGIDIDKYNLDINKNEIFTFLSIGILRTQKNQRFLIENAKELKRRGMNFQIQIVGDGALREELEALIEQENVADVVHMLGLRDDIPALLSQAHALVMPSHYEGLPISLLEAAAAKVPIITTPVGAIPSVMDDSDGYLSPIETFIDTMEHLYLHQDEGVQKAANLYTKIVANYSIKSMAEKHQNIYTRVCES